MADPRRILRQKVSLKKKRFKDDDFDLDLAYITDKIIAFGFPAEGRESVFRNPMDECQRFFETFHGNSYWIYNLCIEKNRQYKPKRFQERVSKYQWADHNAPFLEMLPEFCKHAQNWLEMDESNVIAVHCKAGKGRTGVLICCLLLWQNQFSTPDEAMEFYGNQRTFNGKGVTIPSQKRFIHYFHESMLTGFPPKHTTALVQKVIIERIDKFDDTHFGILIESNGTPVKYKKKGDKGMVYMRGENSVSLNLGTIPVSGNTKITIFKPGKKKEELFHFWFHCHFVRDTLKLRKLDLDKAASDKEHKIFPEDFAVEVVFEKLDLYDNEENFSGSSFESNEKHSSNTNSVDAESETAESESVSEY